MNATFLYVKYLTKKQVLNSIDFANANVRNFRNIEQLDINQKHLKVPLTVTFILSDDYLLAFKCTYFS